MILSYTNLFITIPLNSDTTGTYKVGENFYTYLSYKSSIEIGRWSKGLLELFIEKLGYYNVIPFFLFILLIFVCVYFIYNLTELFNFNNLIMNIMISAIFFVTPAFVSLFTYYQDLYAHIFAIFLSSVIIKACFIEKKWFVYVPALAIVIGLYQSYLNLVCSIYIVFCIYNLFSGKINDKNFKNSVREFVRFTLYSLFAVVFYYILFMVCLRVFNVDSIVSDRFGADLSINGIIHSVFKIYGMVLVLPFKNYAGLNTTLLMKIVFLCCFLCSIFSLVRFATKNNLKMTIAMIILWILFPISMNCVVIATSHIVIRMTIGLGIIYVFFATNIDYFIDNIKVNIVRFNSLINIIVVIIIVHMIYYSNGFVFMSKLVSDSTKSFTDNLVSTIKGVEGYDAKYKVYLHGAINDENLKDYFVYYDANVFPLDAPRNFLLFPWEYKEAINRFSAFYYEEPTNIEKENIINSLEFNEMGLYPNQNSIRIIDNILVVKFER